MTKRARLLGLCFMSVALCLSFIASNTVVTKQASAATTSDSSQAGANFNNLVVVDDPEAIYESARIVHNVTVNGRKGMRIHAKFRVRYAQDVACMLIAYFYYDDSDNTPLKAGDANYRTREGNVSAHANFTPAYDPAVYDDLQMFVPYDALNMESGDEYDLKFYLALYDKEGERFFGKSGWYKFHLTMP